MVNVTLDLNKTNMSSSIHTLTHMHIMHTHFKTLITAAGTIRHHEKDSCFITLPLFVTSFIIIFFFSDHEIPGS